MEQVKFENINWTELHKEIAMSVNCNELITIFKDGSFEKLGSNTVLRNDTKAVAVLRTWGIGNIGFDYYANGWTTENEDGTYTTDDGRVLSAEEVIAECIEDGDHTDQINMWIEEINRQIEECEKSF